jgi:hypothetical protein
MKRIDDLVDQLEDDAPNFGIEWAGNVAGSFLTTLLLR